MRTHARTPRTPRFWDTRSGRNSATVSTPGDNLYLAWAPDGQQLAVVNKQDVFSIVDFRRMKVRTAATPLEAGLACISCEAP